MENLKLLCEVFLWVTVVCVFLPLMDYLLEFKSPPLNVMNFSLLPCIVFLMMLFLNNFYNPFLKALVSTYFVVFIWNILFFKSLIKYVLLRRFNSCLLKSSNYVNTIYTYVIRLFRIYERYVIKVWFLVSYSRLEILPCALHIVAFFIFFII